MYQLRCASEKSTLAGYMWSNWDTNAFVGEDAYVLHIDECNGLRIVELLNRVQLIRSGMNNYGISTKRQHHTDKSDYRASECPVLPAGADKTELCRG